MHDDTRPAPADHLAQAEQVIARQAEEIERLRQQLAGRDLARELRQAFSHVAAASTIASPVSHPGLLDLIVATATRVIDAGAASLALVDEASRELVFQVALGQKAAEVKKLRVPLGHGIAGLVAVSGQPMAISDAQRDRRHASDIAARIGHVPRSILCVPLFYRDQVIGVLELLDKRGAPSFTPSDMETLRLFAEQAAISIEQSRTRGSLAALIREVLESDGEAGPISDELRERAVAFAVEAEGDLGHLRSLELAGLVADIAHRGEDELRTCRTILLGFADYARARSRTGDDLLQF